MPSSVTWRSHHSVRIRNIAAWITAVFGCQTDDLLVVGYTSVLDGTAAAAACPGGPIVASLGAGTRVLTIQRSEDSAWLGVRNPNDFGDVMWLANADLVIDPAQRAVFTLPVGALIVLSLTALRDFSAGGQAFPPTQEEFRAHGNVNGGSLWCDGPTVGAGEAPFGILSTAPGAFTIRYDISAQTDDQLRRHQGAFALARRLRLRCGRCEKRTMHPGRDRREPRALHGGTPLECGRAIRDPTPAFRALE